MNILLLGSGGREHALAWKISKSTLLGKLFIAPGNAGTANTGQNVSLNPNNFREIADFALKEKINLIVVGPEEPLVNGIYDYFTNDLSLSHIAILGPSKAGAQLEGSKDFAKEFMLRHHIPTAKSRTFTSSEIIEAENFIRSQPGPYVLKADGLAAGKGVIIVENSEEAIDHLNKMLVDRQFGNASDKVVIEEFLRGIELSVFVLTDGKNWLLLPEAKDYKRIGKADTGPNTGGMGSISPVRFADSSFMKKVTEQIIQPTIRGLAQDNIDYKGFIFFGLINVDGNPFVIEYNCRMGDPETESVMPRIKNDLVPYLYDCAKGNIDAEWPFIIDEKGTATVMLVSGGYPGGYQKGFPISGLSDNQAIENTFLFHAGTAFSQEGDTVTAGGRVIAVTTIADDPAKALEISYQIAEKVDFKGKYYRNDIGFDIL
jgi:phosphoribosylamine---glycine ligase